MMLMSRDTARGKKSKGDHKRYDKLGGRLSSGCCPFLAGFSFQVLARRSFCMRPKSLISADQPRIRLMG
jgi:hypothetical protein